VRVGKRVIDTQAPPLSPIMEKVARLRESGHDPIVLAQAMVDYAPPRTFTEALISGLREGEHGLQADEPCFHHYAPDPGLPELRRALASYVARAYGYEADPESEIMITPGANHAAYMALSAILEPGDEAVVVSPWYFNHVMTLRLLDAGIRVVAAPAETAFVPRIEEILDAVTPRTRVLVLVNPNNPTGARYPDSWVAALCRAVAGDSRWSGIWVLSDQTYQEIFFDGEHPRSPASLPGFGHRVLTVGSFSKSLACAGWRIGFLTGPREFMDQVLKIQDSSVICASRGVQWAVARTLEAVEALEDYLAEKREILRRRRDALVESLEEDDRLWVHCPGGACFVFLSLPDGVDGEAFASALLDAQGVAAIPGIHFGPGWGSFLRLSFGTEDAARLREAGHRIREFLTKWLEGRTV